jgi:intein/homing endonuclease
LLYGRFKEIIKLTLIDGRELKCTPEHQFKVLRNNEVINKEAKERRVFNIFFVCR